jgi:hypothetical protein
MLPTTFKEQNFTFNKPSSMTDEECGDLDVWKGKDSIGYPVIISCWKLSLEDLNRINETGCVWLSITGNGMPPV